MTLIQVILLYSVVAIVLLMKNNLIQYFLAIGKIKVVHTTQMSKLIKLLYNFFIKEIRERVHEWQNRNKKNPILFVLCWIAKFFATNRSSFFIHQYLLSFPLNKKIWGASPFLLENNFYLTQIMLQ